MDSCPTGSGIVTPLSLESDGFFIYCTTIGIWCTEVTGGERIFKFFDEKNWSLSETFL